MYDHKDSFRILLGLLATAALAASASAADWICAPGQFTHSPETGERVTQYAPVPPVYVSQDPTYVKSGYRNTRSSSSGRGGARHLHVVEEWGQEVRPYGEWLFPYRPYSVPYQYWGEPYGGLAPNVVNYGPINAGRSGGYHPGGRGRHDSGYGGRYPGGGHDDHYSPAHGGGYEGWHGGGNEKHPRGGGYGGGDYGTSNYGYLFYSYPPYATYPYLPPPYGGFAPPGDFEGHALPYE